MEFKIKNSKLKIVPKAFGTGCRGFTLIELLVVIGIIVLLAGIVMPNFMKQIDKAKKTRGRADIHSLENALAMYQTDYGVYPGETGGNADGAYPSLEGKLQYAGTEGKGPYLSKDIPKDPYGTSYYYKYPGATSGKNPLGIRGYDLWSYGKDKAPDTTDDIACWDTETN
ncbi:MAG: type II secretion system major pseudopilin GspG [bacterium]